MRIIARAFFVAVGVASAAPAFAADLAPAPAPTPEPAPNDWHYQLTLTALAPSLTANMGIRTFPTSSVYASFPTILDHLEGIVPLSFAAFNDNFILATSVFWVREGAGGLKTTFGPGEGEFGGINANVTLNETIATAFGGVRLPIPSPNLGVYGILGAAFFNVNASLTLQTPVLGFSRSASQSKTWADEIVGLTANYGLDKKWFLQFETYAGGYSGSATAMGYGGVGYKWNPSVTVNLGSRVLYAYEQSAANVGNGSFRLQQTFYGPELDVSYNF